MSRARPTWFGPADRPLFGVVHTPSGDTARGGVVLCPPMGKEHMDTYRGMKMLAQRLADAGYLVLRFDYAGVGDSADDQREPDAVDGWLWSIEQAVQMVRDTGCGPVSAVGLRAGALLLDRAAERLGPLSTVVLWDPVARGRSYVREQQAFYRLGVGGDHAETADDSVVETIGQSLHADAARALSGLELSADASGVDRWVVALREGGSSTRIQRTVDAAGASVLEVPGMEQFVTPASFLVPIPSKAIDAIVAQLESGEPARHPVTFTPVTAATVVGGDGTAVIEHIESIGPEGLFGIRSVPVDAAPEVGKSVVFCATANDTRIGPARLWVELARDAAAAGVVALRFDRRGTGESAAVEADEHTPIYSEQSAADVLTATRAANTDVERVVLAGICSGSWNAAYAASELGAGGVVMVNAIAWSWRRKKSAQGRVVPEDMGVPRSDPAWQKTPRARVKAALQNHLPYPAWRELGRRGVTQVPEVMLRTLMDRGIETTVVLAPPDQRWFDDQRGPDGMKRLARRGATPAIVSVDAGDHSGYHGVMRREISRQVLASVSAPADSRS